MTVSVLAFDGSRFGLTGGSNSAQNTFVNDFHLGGLSYEGNYQEGIATPTSLRLASDPSVDLPVGSARMVMREIGKLGNRTDGLYPPAGGVEKTMKDWLKLHVGYAMQSYVSICIGVEIQGTCYGDRIWKQNISVPIPGIWVRSGMGVTMPPFWYNPSDASLLQIFQAEAPLIQAKMADLYAQSPADSRTIWAMGTEPNLMEQITPEQYAAMYANYWRFIKGIDPGAKVAFGEVFLSEFFEQHEQAITILSRKVVDAKRDAFLSTPTRSWLQSFFETGEVGGLAETIGLSLIVGKVNEALTDRLWGVSGEEYLKRALVALPPDVIPDYVSFHVYPFSVSDQPWSHWQTKLQSFMDSTQARYTAKYGIPAKFLVTEFGNINPNLNATPTAIADQMEHMVSYLESRNDTYGWWWFEPVGQDENLKKVLPEAPLSRLYQRADVSTIPQPYTCSDLTFIGYRVAMMYWPSFCGTSAPTLPSTPTAPQISLPSFWRSPFPFHLVATPSSNGSPSLLSSGSGYRTLTSLPLGASDRSLVTSRLAVDVYLPLNLPNPYWKGNLALSASSPSTGLWNSWLGQVDFAPFAAGNFSTAIFPLDSSQRSSLRNGGDDLQLTLAVNAPSDVVLDNARFLPEGSAVPSFPSTRLTSRTLAAQSTTDWSVSTGILVEVMENGQTHLQASSSGYSVVTSGWLNREDLSGAPEQVKLQFRIATPSPLPSWPGEVGIFVNSPARGIYHVWVGSQSLQGKPYGQWNTLTFSIPTTTAQALSVSGSEFQIQLVLNFPQSGLNFEWKNMEVAQ